MTKFANRLKARIRHNRLLSALFYAPITIRHFFLELRTKKLENAYQNLLRFIEHGTVAARVPGFGYVFEFDIRSDILKRIVILGEYEQKLLEIVGKYVKPEMNVLDIGANIGLYTVLFAKKIASGRRVLAVEPTPNALRLLERNLQNNGVTDAVVVYEGVAADKAGKHIIKTIPGKEEYSTLGDRIHHAYLRNLSHVDMEVPGETIDHLVEKFGITPGFIKIDTEGAEFSALSGAEKTLKGYHPVILAELADKHLTNFGHSARQVVDLLIKCGYEVIDVATGEPPLHPFEGEILALPNKSISGETDV